MIHEILGGLRGEAVNLGAQPHLAAIFFQESAEEMTVRIIDDDAFQIRKHAPTNRTVSGRDRSRDSRRAVAECDRTRVGQDAVVPIWNPHHVIAVGQRRHAFVAHLKEGFSTDEAVGFRDLSEHSCRAVAERDRTRVCQVSVGPPWTHHHVIAVAQRRHASNAHVIVGFSTDEAVGVRDLSKHSRRAVA